MDISYISIICKSFTHVPLLPWLNRTCRYVQNLVIMLASHMDSYFAIKECLLLTCRPGFGMADVGRRGVGFRAVTLVTLAWAWLKNLTDRISVLDIRMLGPGTRLPAECHFDNSVKGANMQKMLKHWEGITCQPASYVKTPGLCRPSASNRLSSGHEIGRERVWICTLKQQTAVILRRQMPLNANSIDTFEVQNRLLDEYKQTSLHRLKL